MRYDCVIIGAGVGGLFSALSLAQNGKKVIILEKQPVPGGCATVFKRKGFVFESSLHCVDSLGKDGEMRKFLEDAGFASKIDFIDLENFARVIYPEHDFVLDFSSEHFKEYLINNFPSEAENIQKLFLRIGKFYNQFDNFCHWQIPYFLKIAISPVFFSEILKISRLTLKDLLKQYIKDEKLIGILSDLWRFIGLPPSMASAFYFLLVFRGYYFAPTCYVKGGFGRLFEVMVQEMKRKGVEFKFNTSAVKIVTQKGRAKSVITDKGDEIEARSVISNANAVDTLTKFLDDDSLKQKYAQELKNMENSVSAFQVYLGLSVPAKNLGMNQPVFSINATYDHDNNFQYCLTGDYEECPLELVDHAQIDPGLVPQGKGSLLVMTLDSYTNWEDLAESEYIAKKEKVAQILIRRVEKYLPGFSKYIEVKEIATPLTVERFTQSTQGAIYGFSPLVRQSGENRLPQKTRIKGLYLAGEWTWPGPGVHGCFISGLQAGDLVLDFLK
ncbi:MAG: NAD(P)/FAD-dependent oxidoreductase [Candidatus Omnitrophica bacterium]|nr:NAD(P)/FAD-dependent oxidoreductase [Candidatus Omnitrophota bacterium]